MRYGLSSLKAGYIGDYIQERIIGLSKWDTGSLDYGSYFLIVL